MKLRIRFLTPGLWPALEDLFGERGACNGCWCMYWRIGSAHRKRPKEMNKAALAPRHKGLNITTDLMQVGKVVTGQQL
jgi:hypothetical protein